MKTKRLCILGSTGSIGVSALDVVRQHPGRFAVEALVAGANVEIMARQVLEHRPRMAVMATEEKAAELKKAAAGYEGEIVYGPHGYRAAVQLATVDSVVSAIVGAAGLEPTLWAIEAGKEIGLANKETLVTAGELVNRKVKEHGVTMLPIDSEHSAIFQALEGNKRSQVKRLILTASGGPFRTWPKEKIARATVEEALKHPNWAMGRKITIDSAGLMNKGLEVIEAMYLFDMTPDQVGVVVHPQSIVHSMVEYIDASIMAQLSVPDMRLPIAYALAWPDRIEATIPFLDWSKTAQLTFEEVDHDRFPCLGLAFAAIRAGGSMPAVLNAANEVTVEAFLDGRIGFYDIPAINESVMGRHRTVRLDTLEQVRSADRWAREEAARLVAERTTKSA